MDMFNTNTINKLRIYLKGFIISGGMSQDEVSEIMQRVRNGDTNKKEHLFEVEKVAGKILTKSQLSERWNLCKTQIRKLEKAGHIKRIPGMIGHPRYRLVDIIKYEEGEGNKND